MRWRTLKSGLRRSGLLRNGLRIGGLKHSQNDRISGVSKGLTAKINLSTRQLRLTVRLLFLNGIRELFSHRLTVSRWIFMGVNSKGFI